MVKQSPNTSCPSSAFRIIAALYNDVQLPLRRQKSLRSTFTTIDFFLNAEFSLDWIYRVPLERILLIPLLRSVCQWQCGPRSRSDCEEAAGCVGEGWNGIAVAGEGYRRRRSEAEGGTGRGGGGVEGGRNGGWGSKSRRRRGRRAGCRETRHGTMGKINRWNLGTM